MTHQFSPQMTKPLQDSRILIIDDLVLNREVIVNYLEKEGFRYITTCSDGDAAVEKAIDFEPDLIIFDIATQQASEIETLKKLRANPLFMQVPILVQTIINSPEERIKAWESGASDILYKPVDRRELISRLKAQLTNVYQVRELEYYYEKSQDDVDQSLELQRLLLPTDETVRQFERKHDIKIHSLFVPSRCLSGDLCGLIDINDHKLGIWIADFSGKGIRAALNTFRLHTLIQEYQYCAEDPDEFIDALNTRLVELMPVGQFSTFLIGVIDFQSNTFEYAAAGATHPLVYYPEKGEFTFGDATGTPLGIVKNGKYPLRRLTLSPGGTLLLYSDVLWEKRGIPGISFVDNNIEPLLKEIKGKSITSVLKEHIQLLGNPFLPDDLTLLEIQRKKRSLFVG